MEIFYILASSSNQKSFKPVETKGKRVKKSHQNDDFVASLTAYIFGWRNNPQIYHHQSSSHPARIENTVQQRIRSAAIQFPRSLRQIVPDRFVELMSMRSYLPSRQTVLLQCVLRD
jgi:hypothetical protein